MISLNSERGLVTKKFNEYFYVDIQENLSYSNQKRFLCTSRKSIRFKNKFIFVGDEVIVSQIDEKAKTAVITNLIQRKNLLKRPSVANISDIYVTCSVDEPKLNFSQ